MSEPISYRVSQPCLQGCWDGGIKTETDTEDHSFRGWDGFMGAEGGTVGPTGQGDLQRQQDLELIQNHKKLSPLLCCQFSLEGPSEANVFQLITPSFSRETKEPCHVCTLENRN